MPHPSATAGVHYEVAIPDVHTHLFHIRLTIAQPAAQQLLQLPAWIPGSYMVREFSKHLQELQAQQEGSSPTLTQLDKHSWQVSCRTDRPLTLCYRIYAHDQSVRTAFLNAQRGFFNGTSLFLRVPQAASQHHTVAIQPPAHASDWLLATGLDAVAVDDRGFGLYTAPDYDHLVDCPVEMGAFWSGSFHAYGVEHRFVVTGTTASFDGARLLADTQAICESQLRLWHPGIESGATRAPFERYTFMLHTCHDGYGGLEHRNSTALIASRKDLPRHYSNQPSDGYTTLLGLISHEYFHSWNVKRLRPHGFESYDYQQENYTELLWFFEGFTSYYDDLQLVRSGRIDAAGYLKQLTQTIQQVHQAPGRQVQSVAQASWDAWIKYYRQDENTPNATISYYTKGSLVALCLDLTLRREGHGTLDEVMRHLWQRCSAGPMTEADVLAALHAVGQRDYSPEISAWVHGTADLPITELLQAHGVRAAAENDKLSQQLGLRTKDSSKGVHIRSVLRGGAAEQAGMCPGDDWIAVQLPGSAHGWRLTALDDLPLYTGTELAFDALVARDQRIFTLRLHMPQPSQSLRLEIADADRIHAWLTQH